MRSEALGHAGHMMLSLWFLRTGSSACLQDLTHSSKSAVCANGLYTGRAHTEGEVEQIELSSFEGKRNRNPDGRTNSQSGSQVIELKAERDELESHLAQKAELMNRTLFRMKGLKQLLKHDCTDAFGTDETENTDSERNSSIRA